MHKGQNVFSSYVKVFLVKVLNQQPAQRMFWWDKYLVLCLKGYQSFVQSATFCKDRSQGKKWPFTQSLSCLKILIPLPKRFDLGYLARGQWCFFEIISSRNLNLPPWRWSLIRLFQVEYFSHSTTITEGVIEVVRTETPTSNSLSFTRRSSLELDHSSSGSIKNWVPLMHRLSGVNSWISFPLVQLSATFIVPEMWCNVWSGGNSSNSVYYVHAESPLRVAKVVQHDLGVTTEMCFVNFKVDFF